MSSPTPVDVPGAARGRGGPRGGRGGPRGRGFRGRGRGGPRGRGGRGGPRGRGRGGPRGRGGSPNVNALGLDSHVKAQKDADSPNVTERVQYSSTGNKRHSKIQITGQPLSTQGLDIEGLENTRKSTEVTVKKGGSLASRWQQQMQQQKEDDFQKNRDKLRGRRRGGVKFMDTQIRNLITEMKRLSAGPGSGMATVTYGVLFDSTIDSMPALSATLAVAKKRDVVIYDGDMLMQGVHSNVLITLVKDQIEDTPDFQSIIGAAPIKMPQDNTFSTSMCCQCNKTVYPMDRVAANGKTMHKTCFKCCECQTSLKLANFAFNGGKFYCETHFQQKYKGSTSYDF